MDSHLPRCRINTTLEPLPLLYLFICSPSMSIIFPPRPKKQSQGRRKIEMKLIQDENARVVTFSKRRNGIFKKAAELSTMCGNHTAITIFSPCGRVYSFGHPNADSVVDDYLNGNDPVLEAPNDQHHHDQGSIIEWMEEECDQMKEGFQVKERKGMAIGEIFKNSENDCLSSEPVRLLGVNELKEMKEKLEKFQDRLIGCSSSAVNIPAGFEMDDGDASPIPSDWLKL